MKNIVLYLHVHQPYRVRDYSIFEIAKDHNYFDADYSNPASNHTILDKVSDKSYLPTNKILLDLLNSNPDFCLSMSITGTVLDQLQQWRPEVLQSFRDLVDTGRVEIIGETYYHSLAYFYSFTEFSKQVQMHREAIQRLFGVKTTAFRGTELAYDNNMGVILDAAGYKAILAEGWDTNLDWRTSNHVYKPKDATQAKLLLKNYKLSDDIAFRFSDKNWSEYPVNASKYAHWLNETEGAEIFNLFMDYETFGEHQWADSGIHSFLSELPEEWTKSGNGFMTVTQAAESYDAKEEIDFPHTVTWADTERDLSAWIGNSMQQDTIAKLYQLEPAVFATDDLDLISDWRKLTASDHFYYMCTKYWSDGDVHAYFSPYDSPYEAYINYMNCLHDLRSRLLEKNK
jgi:alpha-amylase